MLTHHIKMALRHFQKNKFFSIINLLGLSFGLCISLLIYLHTAAELSHDTFHSEFDKIYRFYTVYNINNTHSEDATTPRPLARALEDLNEVVITTKIQKPSTLGANPIIKINDESFIENQALLADSNFFKVFSFEMLPGNSAKPLKEPYSIMLSESTSQKYFADADPVGSFLELDGQEYLVTGLFKDVPFNSHLKFDILISISSLKNNDVQDWINAPSYTYGKVLVENLDHFRKKLKAFSKEKVAPDLQNRLNLDLDKFYKAGGLFHFDLEPLKDIHLYSSKGTDLSEAGSIENVRLLIALAIVVLLVSTLNFINLNTSMGLERTKEVGLKKVFGIRKSDLQGQILTESILMCLLATLLATIFVATLMPFYTDYTGDTLNLLVSIPEILSLITFALILGVLSGIYPAWYFSKIRLTDSLKGKILKQNVGIKNTFVILQFSITIGLIAFLIILKTQVNYLKSRDLGLDKERVVYIKNADRLGNIESTTIVNEFNQISSVKGSGIASSVPFSEHQSILFNLEGSSQQYTSFYNWINHSFVELMDFDLIEGRNISKNPKEFEVLVNESLAKNLDVDNPIGHRIDWLGGGLVVGIIKDFNFQSLGKNVEPMMFLSNIKKQEEYFIVKLSSVNLTTMESIEKVWSQFLPEVPFQYEFLNDTFNQTFKSEVLFYRLFGLFTSLALFISFLGLLGLVSYTMTSGIKEMSIRRVLGAQKIEIYTYYLKKFMVFNLKSFLISIPLIFVASEKWLNSYPYRTEITPSAYILGLIVAVIITSSVVSFVLSKTLAVNPVINLRKE